MNRYLMDMRCRGADEARVAFYILNCPIEPEGCWHWQMATSLGYGRARFRGRLEMAHRVSYLLWVGDLVPGLQIDHLCRNKWCVNPHHLEQVAPIVNQMRGSPRQAFCHRGHALTDENVYVARKTRHRDCKLCRSIRDASRAPLRRAARLSAHVAATPDLSDAGAGRLLADLRDECPPHGITRPTAVAS